MVSAEPMRVVGLGEKPEKPRRALLQLPSRYGRPGHVGAGGRHGARGGAVGAASDPIRQRWRRRATRGARWCHSNPRWGGTSGGAAIREQTATSPQPRGGFVARRLGAAVGTLGDEVATSNEEVRDGHGRGGYTPRCRPGRTTMTTQGGAGLFRREGIKEVRTQKAPSTTRKPTPRKSEGL